MDCENETNIHVCIIGDAGIGKNCFIEKINKDIFKEDSEPRIKNGIITITYKSNYGKINFKIRDASGEEEHSVSIFGYIIGNKAAIVMFDLGSRKSMSDADCLIRDYKRVCPNSPIILCGNKSDKPSILQSTCRFGDYLDISIKENIGLDMPFLKLAKIFTKKEDLVFVENKQTILIGNSIEIISDKNTPLQNSFEKKTVDENLSNKKTTGITPDENITFQNLFEELPKLDNEINELENYIKTLKEIKNDIIELKEKIKISKNIRNKIFPTY